MKKMMRWCVVLLSFLLLASLLFGSFPVFAATAYSPTSDSDEHPWDFLKHAYRVEVLVVTTDYVLFAVWYTKEQTQPTLVRIDLRSESSSGSNKTRAKNSYIFTE
ncbi:MAG TPA: hypothetical protein VFR89_07375 [candidate division Zixibacteria bacterium]|nr:hypothetical protein [candidate division Zixibacteria bacterium]